MPFEFFLSFFLSENLTLTWLMFLPFEQISYDIVEDILVQSDRMRDTLQELQDAVYLTKVHLPLSYHFKD